MWRGECDMYRYISTVVQPCYANPLLWRHGLRTRGSEFPSPPGSGMKKFFFACYIHNKPKALIGQCTYFLINIYYYFIYPTQFILIAGGMVLHRRVSTKVRTELPSITRLCRDMTERLLKYNNVVLFFTK